METRVHEELSPQQLIDGKGPRVLHYTFEGWPVTFCGLRVDERRPSGQLGDDEVMCERCEILSVQLRRST